MTSKPTSAPASYVFEIAEHLYGALRINDREITVLRRPLSMKGNNFQVGVFTKQWRAQDQGLIGQGFPSIAEYDLSVECLVKHADEEEGHELHSILTKGIRRILAEDEPLKLRLAAISDSYGNSVERFMRLKIERQDFFANQVDGDFVLLSETYVKIETGNC